MFHRTNTRVPINTASESQLRSLPGIGLRTAKAIMDYREKVGPIDEEKLLMIPYIRMSKELLDLIDFIPYGRQYPTTQYDEMDKFSDTFHRSSLHDSYYHGAQMPYADSDVNFNSRFPGCDKSYFRQDCTSAGTILPRTCDRHTNLKASIRLRDTRLGFQTSVLRERSDMLTEHLQIIRPIPIKVKVTGTCK
ncbi:hypothetical protein DPMN_098400 [Dreissena polymorpha]|uniref:Helix-hairpin-helix DNA-binding motif class 1 domain-containing protein n=1 Tax=Dreissena polymorpha TaxID=45954 RepID=A0A9D4LC41_DREPO|nr:hypothetical protein DPMN_098400 [Dreissena polymorpha]